MVIDKGVNLKERWELIGEVNQIAIQGIHHALRNVKANPEQYDEPVQLIEDMEFTLQGLWKFTRDADYHIHWKDIKGCTCPKMDNEDPMYFGGGKITVSDCPWHWEGDKE